MANRYTEQIQRLHRVRQAEKIQRLIYRTMTGLSILMVISLTLLLLESAFHFPSPTRLVCVLSFSLLLMGYAIWAWGFPLISFFYADRPSDDDIAEKIGRVFPQIRDRLLNAMQLIRNHQLHQETSYELAESALEIVDGETRNFDYKQAVTPLPWKLISRYLSLISITWIALFLTIPHVMSDSWTRLAHPRTYFGKPRLFEWRVQPGNIRIVQGDSLTVSVNMTGQFPKEVLLMIEEHGRQIKKIPLSFPFEYKWPAVQQAFEYQLVFEEDRSPVYNVDVMKRPVVRRLDVQLLPPAYTNLPVLDLDSNTGDIQALKGTRANISISASQPMNRAVLKFKNNPPRTMLLTSPLAVKSQFSIETPDQYWIAITDKQGLTNSNPIVYTVQVRPDLNPVARITYPGKDVDLDEQMQLPLTIEAEDDFGFSKTHLVYWVNRGGLTKPAIPETTYLAVNYQPDNARRFIANPVWDLDALALIPKDAVSYYFEVWDNDLISGPKPGRSGIYTARFPSLLEIFNNVSQIQDDQIHSLEEIMDESAGLQDELHDLSEDFKANREISWEEKRQMKESIEKQAQLDKEIDQLQSQFEELTDRLEKNDLISPETLEKYQELQSLFQEIARPELMTAMQKFQDALDQMDQDALRQAAENMEINQDMLLQSLDRTIALLKRIQIEQKIEEMAKRVENMSEQQNEVNETLNEQGASEDLARQENNIQEDASAFEDAMQSLSKDMNEIPDMPMKEMQSLMDSLNQTSLSQQMEQMKELLMQQQTLTAQQDGEQISQSLTNMSMGLQQMKQAMQQKQNQKAQQALQKAAFQTLQLSESQENLMKQMLQGGISGSSASQNQGAMIQGVQQVSDSLFQLSRQMMQISPQLGQTFTRARSQMQQALQAMQESGGANRNQAQAMGSLNEAVAMMEDLLDAMQNGGGMGGMGMDQFMSQLGNMSEQQMALNRKLADMLGQGAMTMQQQAALSRLAAEQRAIQQRMEQFMRDYGERSDVAGRLGDLVDSMEEVIKELKQNQASKKTIERQERILSRMLEAQRSMNERDFSRKRMAQTGQDILRQSPGQLNLNRSELRDQIMRDILRLNEAGYTKDYQELIRQYFDALVKVLDESETDRK